MFFIIWGWRGREKELSRGNFFCPECNDYRGYRLVMVNRWFTLYWIPLFKTKELGQYIECESCKSTFNERVLSFDPKTATEKFEAAVSIATKRVMFKLALADGEIDDAEIQQITRAFANITHREIDPADIAAELEAARDDPRTVTDYVREISSELNDTGKELVLRSAIAVAKSDGSVDERELSELHQLAGALDFPKSYANGIFAEEGIKPI